MIALAWRLDARWPLLLMANRDEFHARPAEPLAPVSTVPGLLAGTDRVGGGHWLGVLPDGRFAAVTNARLGLTAGRAPAPRSRGELVSWALRDEPAGRPLPLDGAEHGPFGLLWVDAEGRLRHRSNAFASVDRVNPGVHVLSNGPFDADWPKARRAQALLRDWLADGREDPATLLDGLQDRRLAADADLPDTGVGLALERRLSPLFIDDPVYGTRCSTVVAFERGGLLRVWERRYGSDGMAMGDSAFGAQSGSWQAESEPIPGQGA